MSKLYLTDVIRRECWDDMLVKGRGLVVSELQHLFLTVIQQSSTRPLANTREAMSCLPESVRSRFTSVPTVQPNKTPQISGPYILKSSFVVLLNSRKRE